MFASQGEASLATKPESVRQKYLAELDKLRAAAKDANDSEVCAKVEEAGEAAAACFAAWDGEGGALSQQLQQLQEQKRALEEEIQRIKDERVIGEWNRKYMPYVAARALENLVAVAGGQEQWDRLDQAGKERIAQQHGTHMAVLRRFLREDKQGCDVVRTAGAA